MQFPGKAYLGKTSSSSPQYFYWHHSNLAAEQTEGEGNVGQKRREMAVNLKLSTIF